MSLSSTFIIKVGASIAKSIVKYWLKDFQILSDTSSDAMDLLESKLSEEVDQRRAARLFEDIGEKIGESLFPIFEIESHDLDESSRKAIMLAIADTLDALELLRFWRGLKRGR